MFYVLVQEWKIPVHIHGHIQIYQSNMHISITYPSYPHESNMYEKSQRYVFFFCMYMGLSKNRDDPKSSIKKLGFPL